MKIKSIKVYNIHKYKFKEMNFDDVTYLVGANGAGKSTILEAVQLGLLGYIPGENKTNASIFSHSSGPTMSVELKIDAGDEGEIIVTRTFTKSGKSVRSDVSISPEIELSEIIEGVELPVFNSSEFLSQSPNMLKKWFQSFLPSEETNIDIMARLKEYIKDIDMSHSAPVVEGIENFIKNTRSGSGSDSEYLAVLNEHIKQLLSLNRKQIQDNQSTINQLIYYDDFNDAREYEDYIKEMSELDDKLTYINQLRRNIDRNNKIHEQISELPQSVRKYSEAVDPDITCKLNEHSKLSIDLSELKIEETKYIQRLSDIKVKLATISNILKGKGICPYTNAECESIKDKMTGYTEEYEHLSDELKEMQAELAENTSKQSDIKQHINELTSDVDQLRRKHAEKRMLEQSLVELPEEIPGDFDSLLSDINDHKQRLMENMSKSKANRQYKDMVDKLTEDKFKYELDHIVLKRWFDVTGPNGLQNELMANPLEKFSTTFNKYIKQLFNEEDVSAGFNTSSKSNSFSFGINRSGTYIPYVNLSSAEKCMFLLAFMTMIIKESDSHLKTVIVDDLFDHLDDKNIKFVMTNLTKVNGCQYIIAGVHDVDVEGITKVHF